MLLVGAVTPMQAWAAVNLEILALLFGMLALVAGLEVAGVFNWLAGHVVRHARDQRRLLVMTMLAGAVLSALVLNDAVVLVFTPVLVKACRLMRISCMPYLIALAMSANIGSVATLVGNPQNAFIGLTSGIGFLDYAVAMTPLAALSLALATALSLWFFRRELASPIDREALRGLPGFSLDRRLAPVAIACAAAAFAGFTLSSFVRVPLHLVAFAAGLAVIVLSLAGGSRAPVRVLRRVDFTVLLLFVGLFVVLAGVEASGIAATITSGLGGEVQPLRLAAITALLSNLVSNVPAVILLSPHVAAAGASSDWLLLAAASTLAGNATILGAAANIIVAESARAFGEEFDVKRFALLGMPLTTVTLAAALLLLGLGR